jgi:hypothetical protein
MQYIYILNILIILFIELIIGINKIKPLIITATIGILFLYPFLLSAIIPSTILTKEIANIKFIIKYEIATPLLKPGFIGADNSIIACITTYMIGINARKKDKTPIFECLNLLTITYPLYKVFSIFYQNKNIIKLFYYTKYIY